MTAYSILGGLLALTGFVGTIAGFTGGIPRWYLAVTIPAFLLGVWIAQRNTEEERAFALARSDLERIPMPTALPPSLTALFETHAHIPAMGSADRRVTIVHGTAWKEEVDSEGERYRPQAYLAFARGFPEQWSAEVDLRSPMLPRWLAKPTMSGGSVAELIEKSLRDTRTPAKVTLRDGWLLVVGYGADTGLGTVRLARTTELMTFRLASIPTR